MPQQSNDVRPGLTTRPADHRRPVSVGGLVARFTVAGLVVLLALAALIAFLARQAGTDQAIETARQVTFIAAKGIVEPRLTPEVVAGDTAALEAFNTAMQDYVLEGSLVRVKVWKEDGTIVYSDESRLIGKSFDLDTDEREAMSDLSSDSEISDLDEPENVYERPYEKLLEVYVGVRGTDDARLLFEAYFRYDAVIEAGQAQWEKFAPPSLGALLVLELVQIPFAFSLARRIQRQQRDGERLLQHAVDASGRERRRIAGDLHDGIVQEITGLTYTLDAARLSGPDPQRDAQLIAQTAAQLRSFASELRSLMVAIYPPDLAEEGLPAALAELASGLERGGMSVDLDVDGAAELPLDAAAVLFRAAQEVLRNVAAHSGATVVSVSVTRAAGRATLVVDDDGVGFEQARLGERLTDGHVGLRSLGDLVADAGGALSVSSARGLGTRVEVVVPTG